MLIWRASAISRRVIARSLHAASSSSSYAAAQSCEAKAFEGGAAPEALCLPAASLTHAPQRRRGTLVVRRAAIMLACLRIIRHAIFLPPIRRVHSSRLRAPRDYARGDERYDAMLEIIK